MENGLCGMLENAARQFVEQSGLIEDGEPDIFHDGGLDDISIEDLKSPTSLKGRKLAAEDDGPEQTPKKQRGKSGDKEAGESQASPASKAKEQKAWQDLATLRTKAKRSCKMQ
eukprot:11435255-Alexandrium_andersonii.AAC.1